MDERDLMPDYISASLKRVSGGIYSAEGCYMHLIIEYISRGRAFFTQKGYHPSGLNMHIPLPLQAVLCANLTGLRGIGGAPMVDKSNRALKLLGMVCVPAYENRIVISIPETAHLAGYPLVLIELDRLTNYPTYYELN